LVNTVISDCGGSAVRTTRKTVVGPVSDFPIGTKTRIEIDGRAIAIFSVDSGFYALRDVCPHRGAPLSAGSFVGWLEADGPGCYRFDSSRQLIKCPWHGWEYELATGQSWYDPVRDRVRAYSIDVQGGQALLDEVMESNHERLPGPYVAETFTLSVE